MSSMALATVKADVKKIEASDLNSFMDLNESLDDKKLMELADVFGRALSVFNSPFPWVEDKFTAASVAQNVDTPVTYIPNSVYKKIVSRINECDDDVDAVVSFASWALYSILANHTPAPARRNPFYHPSRESEMGLFAVLGLVLHAKPDVLVKLLPTLRECLELQGLDKLPLVIWIIGQASQNDPGIGLYAWTRTLLPIVSGCTVDSKKLISIIIVDASNTNLPLQYAVVRDGERSIPPDSFDMLMRVRFPLASAHLKGIDNIKSVYQTLKDIALAGEPGSEAMKEVSQQFFLNSFNSLVEGGSNLLLQEAIEIMWWCFTEHQHCYELWEKLCDENPIACNVTMKKLSDTWKADEKKPILEKMKKTLLNSQKKNAVALVVKTVLTWLVNLPFLKTVQTCLANFIRSQSHHKAIRCFGSFVCLALLASFKVNEPLNNSESWLWETINSSI